MLFQVPRLGLLAFVVAILAACAQPPEVKVDRAPPAPPDAAPVYAEPSEPPPPAPPPPSRAPTAQERAEAQKLALRAVDPLNAGDEATARRDLERALSLDPENKLAASLMRQITEDPAAIFGSQYFTHRLQRDESLSMLAGRFLGDIYLFYGLARYNDIRVPRQVHVGQTIRVPGKAPPQQQAKQKPLPPPSPPTQQAKVKETQPPVAPPEPSRPEPVAVVSPGQKSYERGLQLAKSGDRDNAYEAFREALRLDPQHREARAQLDKSRQDVIQFHRREATAALQRRNLDPAMMHTKRVLDVDPNNTWAKPFLQHLNELAEKLKQFPEKK